MKKIAAGLVAVTVVGVLIGYGASWLTREPEVVVEQAPVAVVEELPSREVQLYFTARQGDFLIPERADIPGCEEDAECIRSLVTSLLRGSQEENLPVLPGEAEVLGVEVENDLVRINFSRKLADLHPGGSLSELLSVYSVANSVSDNFPYLRQVQFLIEGEARQTLKGHVRIDQPIYADFSFNHPPADGVTDVKAEAGTTLDGLGVERVIEDSVN